ncbi:putative alpha-ketoglutarate-dependent dioxygenase ABH6-like protein [Thamnocephalis sphaerospora]|uniref:Putative alpha-ketoglutarate-dependent dioxygenase ABH6-like protein n=1 Tax=Thamnocephalis sphaerospora TaxID=78915 RepID=A0A4P9XK98_9FUNG|nr:putative alpha-ketoglutarate-dependent dioxygenase ABH6-like protein [Thamnocephalis sphaerospora]RKP06613.1 putative alpha-ketoglutarate-dependent dioxygenase ABH6-like protein [Thamnocephalis sphaerospora]|eukprot:RKP06223.1 putative alpha-ketoglutarate-dependent dioxygenase ABH6-like protein [Thamnocephalis sphaerospora]
MEAFRIPHLPSAAYYIPNFITKDEEEALLAKVYAAPKPKWVTLSRRRLQNWGKYCLTVDGVRGVPSARGTLLEPLPAWLTWPVQRLVEQGVFPADAPANHCLVNEYLPGQGIMPHEDGPFYLPCVATISLGSHTVLDLYPPQEQSHRDGCGENGCESDSAHARLPAASLLLERRSLFVQCDDVYRSYMHGIAERAEDDLANTDGTLLLPPPQAAIQERSTRVSLTYRRVAKAIRSPMLFRR